jgi:hypothetical protein
MYRRTSSGGPSKLEPLISVNEKVDREFQGFQAVRLRRILVSQDSLKERNTIHKAVLVIGP